MTIEIKKMAKIGTGVMGTNVIWGCAVNGIDVNLYDEKPGAVERSVKMLNSWFFDGNLSKVDAKAASARLHPCAGLEEALTDVDLAFESVFEDLDVKKNIHEKIGRIAASHVLQGTNASSLMCSPIAEASGRPENFFNMNFTDPHSGEELVEVMWNPKTSESTRKAAVAFAKKIKMIPIVCNKELMGYAFNRIWRAVKKEALYVANSGAASPADIDRAWMLIFGTPHGPFGLMDRIGLDSVHKVEMRYYDDSGDERDKPPKILDDLLEKGDRGEKTGKGFYTWPNPAFKQPEWLRKQGPWADTDDAPD